MEEEIHGADESSDGQILKSDVYISTYIRRDPEDCREFMSLEWVADKEDEEPTDDALDAPPVFLILYPELFERGWGWERLVPYQSGSIEWPRFKKYLEDYFSHNAGQVASLCAHHRSELIGQGIPPAESNVLRDAAKLCIKIENKFLRSWHSYLAAEDIILSRKIKECARRMIQSEGESSAAAAGLVCIMTEAEWMCMSFEHEFNIREMISFSNEVRRSALNLMCCKVTGSDAAVAAAALVGMAKEARKLCSLLMKRDRKIMKYDICEFIRTDTATVLTILEEEFSCNTAGNTAENGIPTIDKPEKPIGRVSTLGDLKHEEPGSMDKNEHSLKDNNVKLISDMRRKLKKEKRKLKRAEKKRLKRAEKRLKNKNEKIKVDKGQEP